MYLWIKNSFLIKGIYRENLLYNRKLPYTKEYHFLIKKKKKGIFQWGCTLY